MKHFPLPVQMVLFIYSFWGLWGRQLPLGVARTCAANRMSCWSQLQSGCNSLAPFLQLRLVSQRRDGHRQWAPNECAALGSGGRGPWQDLVGRQRTQSLIAAGNAGPVFTCAMVFVESLSVRAQDATILIAILGRGAGRAAGQRT